jgi:hypothetical protein
MKRKKGRERRRKKKKGRESVKKKKKIYCLCYIIYKGKLIYFILF